MVHVIDDVGRLHLSPPYLDHNVCLSTSVCQRLCLNVCLSTSVSQRLCLKVCVSTSVSQRLCLNVCVSTSVSQRLCLNVCISTSVSQRRCFKASPFIFFSLPSFIQQKSYSYSHSYSCKMIGTIFVLVLGLFAAQAHPWQVCLRFINQ